VNGAAWLFTPGDEQRKLDSASQSGADCLIADLEDGVAPERKDLAREHAVAFLAQGNDERPRRIVRINDPRTERGRNDLERLAGQPGLTVMVPKASVASLELAHRAGAQTVALVESAVGVSEVERIAALEGTVAVAVGTVDLAAELGLGELPDGLELLHVRSRVVLACALGGVPAIDGVYLRTGDLEGLAVQSRRSRALGFAAKLCIHPAQVAVIREAFIPSAEELDRARAIIDVYERALESSRGAVLDDGEMVDLATVRRARLLLGRAPTA
jgi:citrate lyase subunit beta / citryl-CoA lyase